MRDRRPPARVLPSSHPADHELRRSVKSLATHLALLMQIIWVKNDTQNHDFEWEERSPYSYCRARKRHHGTALKRTRPGNSPLVMKVDGAGAWPSQTPLAKGAHIGLRSVKRHHEAIEHDDWVKRSAVSTKAGRQWPRTEYAASVANTIYDELPERPAQPDPT
jgi:hypothetical protein